MKLLEAVRISVGYEKSGAEIKLLEGIDLTLEDGETVSIVGASGSGKTLTGYTLAGLIPPPLRVLSGIIRFQGMTLKSSYPTAWRDVRGKKIFMLFQSPASALNPVVCVRNQIAEILVDVKKVGRSLAMRRSNDLLEKVGMSAEKGNAFQFQLSGGMRQRVLIALAIALEPAVLIADEPAVGLDPIHQLEILQILKNLSLQHQMAMIVITHDLRIASFLTHRAIVMSQGRILESGSIANLIQTPKHAFTRNLIDSLRFMEGI